VLLPACLSLAFGEPFLPDRPDVSTGTILVEPGALQIESGIDVDFEAALDQRFPVLPLLAFRLGVHPRAELRFFEGEPLRWGVGGSEADPHLAFGAKIRLYDGLVDRLIPAVALLPLIVSRRPGGAWRGDPPRFGLVLLLSQPLARRWSVDLNIGPRADAGVPLPYAFAVLLSASFGYAPHERVLIYAESYYIAAHRDLDAAGFDGGVVITINPRLAFDIGGRGTVTGISSSALMIGMTGVYEGRQKARRRS
jgi:hypothetical protein